MDRQRMQDYLGHVAAYIGKRLSDAPPKQAKRTGAGGVG